MISTTLFRSRAAWMRGSRSVSAAKAATTATLQRIDLEHANAKRHWEQMGKPEYLNAETVEKLKNMSKLQSEPVPVKDQAGQLMIEVPMPPQSVAAIQFSN